ncbi:WG repeat-containing protein [Runella zeae]|uniref:WG repeat-containing protein n=1 Tax=Runella zeae TaxID=94255 RepID=UPI0003FC1588|nr:WG repeat-containing protein [Runella zeae]
MTKSIFSIIFIAFNLSNVFSQKYTIVTQPLYDISTNDIFAFFKGENYKNLVVDIDGSEIHFDNIGFIGRIEIVNRDRFIVQLKNHKYILIDKKGRISSAEYDNMHCSNLKEKLVTVFLKNKIGLLDFNGQIVFEPIYDIIGHPMRDFVNGKIMVELNKRQIIMTEKGKIDYKLPKNFKYINLSEDGTFYGEDTLGLPFHLDKNYNPIFIERFINRKDKKEGLYDNLTKKQVIPLVNNIVSMVGHNQYVVLKDNQFALYDKKGKPIFDFGENLWYGYYRHGIMYVQNKEKKYGFIDTTGKTVIPFVYDKAENFSRQGLTIVSQNGKYALMNLGGKYLTPFKYDAIDHWDLNNELIRVKVNDKLGYINTKGEELTLFNYTMADEFKKGFAVVGINNKKGMIDKTGKEIVQLEYDWIRNDNSKAGRAIVTKNMKNTVFFDDNSLFGIIDNRGNIIVPCIYEYIAELPSHLHPDLYPDNYYYYKKNKKIGILKCN